LSSNEEQEPPRRRSDDPRITHLETEVGEVKAALAGVSVEVGSIAEGLKDVKTIVLADKSRPINYVGWIGIIFSLVLAASGAMMGVANYVSLAQRPIEMDLQEARRFDRRVLDEMLQSREEHAASRMERNYLREEQRDLSNRVYRLEERSSE